MGMTCAAIALILLLSAHVLETLHSQERARVKAERQAALHAVTRMIGMLRGDSETRLRTIIENPYQIDLARRIAAAPGDQACALSMRRGSRPSSAAAASRAIA
ncbi:hypothetical protein [Cupriavidus pinatubonensis]|uniref:hypothetical protein n=1 Tax=Cupriavidus pinatubonensis TaxID=248026 RepID=UPI00361FF532